MTTVTNTSEQTTESSTVAGRPVIVRTDDGDTRIRAVTVSTTVDGRPQYLVESTWWPADQVTLLPVVGERVSVTTPNGGLVSGYWLGARPVGEQYVLTVCDEHAVVQATVPDAASMAYATVATGDVADGAHLDALKALASQTELLRNTDSSHERFMSELVEDAQNWADEHDLCSAFDRFMEDHGLDGREKDFQIEVSGTFSIVLERKARNAEVAAEMFTEAEVLSELTYRNMTVEEAMIV